MINTSYLEDCVRGVPRPGIKYEQKPLDAAVRRRRGAEGISVADPMETHQISERVYFGVTTSSATAEVPHIHMEQTEAYVMQKGEALVWTKWRWDDAGWIGSTLRQGDVFLVQPNVCHWFVWRCEADVDGIAYVFKAPQIPGVGKPPNGKTTCTNGCPHYRHGCVLPQGFQPSEPDHK